MWFNKNNTNKDSSRGGVEMSPVYATNHIASSHGDGHNESVGEDDEDGDYFELEEDIFSLLFVAEVKSITMLYGLSVFVVQVTILFLMYTDLLKDDHRNSRFEKDDNKFNIPVNVDPSVAVSQFLALIIAVVSQADVLMSIDAIFAVRYDRQVVVNSGLPHATLFRWRLYNGLRWLEGTMTLLVSLVIVVQVRQAKQSTPSMCEPCRAGAS
jgi:hypothetical protein